MKTYTVAEVQDIITELAQESPCEHEHDNEGQIVLYTGIFRWSDGTYRDESEPQGDLSEEEELELDLNSIYENYEKK